MLINKLLNVKYQQTLTGICRLCTLCTWNNFKYSSIGKQVSSNAINKTCCGIDQRNLFTIQQRYKHQKKKSSTEEEENDNDEATEIPDHELDSKIVKVKVSSLRTDLIMKSALGLARNKVEAAFYENRIRVNGKKLQKKSSSIQIGDEIDLIKGVSNFNPDNIVVSRIEILSTTPSDEHILLTLKKFKSLTIENYGSDCVWKPRSQPD